MGIYSSCIGLGWVPFGKALGKAGMGFWNCSPVSFKPDCAMDSSSARSESGANGA